MTAPQEPLVMTLEEGLSLAKKYMVAYLEESSWPDELREKWPEDLDADYRTLFERPVVARDDAAELRAAIREWCAAVEAERSAWDSACAAYTDKTLWDKHQEAKRLVIAAEVRLHTLAATEEGE